MHAYKAEICEYIDKNWEIAKLDREIFFNKLKASKYLCLFGAGGMGIDIANYLKEIGVEVDFFCDNNKDLDGRNICNGIKCISFHNLINYKEDVFVLISTRKYKEIVLQLEEKSFDMITVPTSLILKCKKYLDVIDKESLKNNISSLYEILEDENSKKVVSEIIKKWFMPIAQHNKYNYHEINSGIQYLPKDIIKLTNNEIFVDAGAYDGDTIEEFLTAANNEFDGIIAYELDKNCYEKLKFNIQNKFESVKGKITLHNIGLYDKNEEIKYCSNATSSAINPFAAETGYVVRLSDHLKNRRVTFIKMDIEGSEVKALQGAEKIIVEHKPKLAICVYHEPYHLWEIPLYIKSLVPDYKINIRHHSDFNVDTVSYAVL